MNTTTKNATSAAFGASDGLMRVYGAVSALRTVLFAIAALAGLTGTSLLFSAVFLGATSLPSFFSVLIGIGAIALGAAILGFGLSMLAKRIGARIDSLSSLAIRDALANYPETIDQIHRGSRTPISASSTA